MESLALLCTLHADGPTTLKRLRRSGCQSLQDLEAYRPETLATLLEVTPAVARRLGREARVLRERLDLTGDTAVLEREEAPESLTAASTAELPVERAVTTESLLGRHDRAIVDQVVQSWDRDPGAGETRPRFDDEPRVDLEEPLASPTVPTFQDLRTTPAPAEPPVTFLPESTPSRSSQPNRNVVPTTPGEGVEWARVKTPAHDAPVPEPTAAIPPTVEPAQFEAVELESVRGHSPAARTAPSPDAASEADPEHDMDVLGDVRGSRLQDPIPMTEPEAPAPTSRPTAAPLGNVLDGLDADLAERLAAAGIHDLAALAAADCASLAARLGVAFGTLRRLQFLARRHVDTPRTLPGAPIPLRTAARAEAPKLAATEPGIVPTDQVMVSSDKPVPDAPSRTTAAAAQRIEAHRSADLSGRHTAASGDGTRSFGLGVREDEAREPIGGGRERDATARSAAPPAYEDDDEPITDAPPAHVPFDGSSFGAGIAADATRRAPVVAPVVAPPLTLAAPRRVTRPEPMSSQPSAPAAAPIPTFETAPRAGVAPTEEAQGVPVEPAPPRRPFWEARARDAAKDQQSVENQDGPRALRPNPPAVGHGGDADAASVVNTPVGTWSQRDGATSPVLEGSRESVDRSSSSNSSSADARENEAALKDTLGWDFVIPGPDEGMAPAPRSEAPIRDPGTAERAKPNPHEAAPKFPSDEDVAGPFA
tara:strand:+ start:1245 stop:3368 length:2124 start_codon:yes stop_codon:yes gene_type:complete